MTGNGGFMDVSSLAYLSPVPVGQIHIRPLSGRIF